MSCIRAKLSPLEIIIKLSPKMHREGPLALPLFFGQQLPAPCCTFFILRIIDFEASFFSLSFSSLITCNSVTFSLLYFTLLCLRRRKVKQASCYLTTRNSFLVTRRSTILRGGKKESANITGGAVCCSIRRGLL